MLDENLGVFLLLICVKKWAQTEKNVLEIENSKVVFTQKH